MRRPDDATARTAVVTGAASGMGRATAALLARQGWIVVGVDRVAVPDPEPGLVPLVADITDRAGLTAVLTAALAGLPPLGLVANVAGIYPPTTLDTFTEELYRRVFDVNVFGTLAVTAACAPLLSEGGVVVNFASVDAFTVSPGQLLYCASKAAVVMLTKSLALELAPRRIRVVAIAPGWVDTPGNRATGRMDAAAASIPLGRVASPDEIASWVALLASPAAGFMTGETIVLSGGDVLR